MAPEIEERTGILFTIIDRTVFVLHVRHGSMQQLLTEG
jgi:hypothetical protein